MGSKADKKKEEEKARAAKKATSSSRSSKKSSKNDSKDEKKAKKEVKKYYNEKKGDIEKKAEIDTKRLQEDLARIMNESGLAQTRATEDYIRNIGSIEANKGADIAQLNDYVKTNTERTREDLGTALAKESRRFSLESDNINQDLAEKGLTFSERTPEKIAQGETAQNTADINVTAERSFADIARYETAKNAEIALKYGEQTTAAETKKTRSLQDILDEQAIAAQKIQRGEQDVAFGKAIDIKDVNYSANDAVSAIGNYYDAQGNSLANAKLKTDVIG